VQETKRNNPAPNYPALIIREFALNSCGTSGWIPVFTGTGAKKKNPQNEDFGGLDAKITGVQSEAKISVVIILIIVFIIALIFVFGVVFGGVLLPGLCCGELRSNFHSSDNQNNDKKEKL